MNNNLDLEIDKYSDYDLLNLFNCSQKSSEKEIHDNFNKKLGSLERISDIQMKKTLTKFFNDAFKKLDKFFKKYKTEDKKNRVFKNTPIVFDSVNSSLDDTKNIHPSPEFRENNIYSTNTIQYPRGTINPIEKKIECLKIHQSFLIVYDHL